MSENQNQLYFNANIGKNKPESIINRAAKCPFCDVDKLEEIIDRRGTILLVKNKFPVLKDSYQTVLVEHATCAQDLSTYTKEHLYELIDFGLEHWNKMKESGQFRSVMFYKNHGPNSGGTIYHPHMQIIGLENVDCQKNVSSQNFEGIKIHSLDGLEYNLSTQPRMGFYEFNIILTDKSLINNLADYIQITTQYILNHFSRTCNSYNIFFYELNNQLLVKIVPRFVVSPIFVGYNFPQVANNLQEKANQIRELYFS
jgi:ATP adenylyltransferase/5',5'''-P-1,P-4-tetraphosphate phosphorylase II